MLLVNTKGELQEPDNKYPYWEIQLANGLRMTEMPWVPKGLAMKMNGMVVVNSLYPFFIRYFGLETGVSMCCDNALYKVMTALNKKYPCVPKQNC